MYIHSTTNLVFLNAIHLFSCGSMPAAAAAASLLLFLFVKRVKLVSVVQSAQSSQHCRTMNKKTKQQHHHHHHHQHHRIHCGVGRSYYDSVVRETFKQQQPTTHSTLQVCECVCAPNGGLRSSERDLTTAAAACSPFSVHS